MKKVVGQMDGTEGARDYSAMDQSAGKRAVPIKIKGIKIRPNTLGFHNHWNHCSDGSAATAYQTFTAGDNSQCLVVFWNGK